MPRRWDAIIRRDLTTNLADARDALPAGTTERLTRLHERFQPYFMEVPPICFLDDTTTKNVIMLDGVLQGLVDFDWVAYGDPLYLIGLVQMAVAADAPGGQFYVEELCRLWPVTRFQRTVVDFYSAIFASHFLAYRRRQAPPADFSRELAALDRFLARL